MYVVYASNLESLYDRMRKEFILKGVKRTLNNAITFRQNQLI